MGKKLIRAYLQASARACRNHSRPRSWLCASSFMKWASPRLIACQAGDRCTINPHPKHQTTSLVSLFAGHKVVLAIVLGLLGLRWAIAAAVALCCERIKGRGEKWGGRGEEGGGRGRRTRRVKE